MKKEALILDAETKVAEAPNHHKEELRLWLRMLTCVNLIEADVRGKLRDQFETTLPRFDLLAQLERVPGGMTLGELSKRMMVSNGNTTSLVERLLQEGLIERKPLKTDRRVHFVKLTPSGRTEFARMAKAHEDWIAALLVELSPRDVDQLLRLLGKMKRSIMALPLKAR